MNHAVFEAEAATHPLWRFLGMCKLVRMVVLVAGAILIGLIAAFIDGNGSLRAWSIPSLIVTASVFALEAAKRFGNRIKLVVEELDMAIVDRAESDNAIRILLSNRLWELVWGAVIAIVSSGLLYSSTPTNMGIFSRVAFALISLCGGTVFAFALIKYIWDYRLLWALTNQTVSIWKVHKLRPLASYNYSLTLVALLPCLITLYIWAARRTPELFGFAVVQGVLAICVFLITEIRIIRMVKGSAVCVLDRISSIQDELWLESQATNSDLSSIVTELAHLEALRRSLIAGAAFGLISWSEFMAKIAVPFLAGAIGVIYQILVAK